MSVLDDGMLRVCILLHYTPLSEYKTRKFRWKELTYPVQIPHPGSRRVPISHLPGMDNSKIPVGCPEEGDVDALN